MLRMIGQRMIEWQWQWCRHGVDWGGHVTPLLPDASPEIDANPITYPMTYGGGGHSAFKFSKNFRG